MTPTDNEAYDVKARRRWVYGLMGRDGTMVCKREGPNQKIPPWMWESDGGKVWMLWDNPSDANTFREEHNPLTCIVVIRVDEHLIVFAGGSRERQ